MLNRPEVHRTACSGPALPQRAAQAGRSTRRPVPFPVVPAPVMTTAARTSGCRAILTKITRISYRCARSRTELLCIVIQGQTTDRHVASEIGESVGAVERQTGARVAVLYVRICPVRVGRVSERSRRRAGRMVMPAEAIDAPLCRRIGGKAVLHIE